MPLVEELEKGLAERGIVLRERLGFDGEASVSEDLNLNASIAVYRLGTAG